ncbi:MAG: hypothetical protein HQK69_06360, partial [Desulfamplus sp.]|nr:hypothetical protein [Desulfamplus sp.]
MEQNKNKIITIGYLALMVAFIIMLNSGGKHSGKTAHGDDPNAYKEAVEPDAQTAKLAYLNQVLETIA